MSADTECEPAAVLTSGSCDPFGSTTPSCGTALFEAAMKYWLSPGLYQASSAPPRPLSWWMTLPSRSSMISDAVDPVPQPRMIWCCGPIASPCGPVQPVEVAIVNVSSTWNGACLEILRTTPGPAV